MTINIKNNHPTIDYTDSFYGAYILRTFTKSGDCAIFDAITGEYIDTAGSKGTAHVIIDEWRNAR